MASASSGSNSSSGVVVSKPDQDLVNELMGEFEQAFEARDLQRLERVAQVSPDKRQFLEQVFQNYSVIEVSISDMALDSPDSASARMTITGLLDNNGHQVIPGGWKHQQLVTRKQIGRWQKLEW